MWLKILFGLAVLLAAFFILLIAYKQWKKADFEEKLKEAEETQQNHARLEVVDTDEILEYKRDLDKFLNEKKENE